MGRQIKRLSNFNDIEVHVTGPFSAAEIQTRHEEYEKLSLEEFKKKYRNYLYAPAFIDINGESFEIQMNFCCSPFCKWFGLPQKKYASIKSSPSRYKIVGAKSTTVEYIACNNTADVSISGEVKDHTTATISNWSLAEEIERLIKINSVSPLKTIYEFHRPDCPEKGIKPSQKPDAFYKRGKSSAGSQKYQCRECKKITNVLPDISGRFNYGQKLDGILIDFAKDIMSRTPVKKTCAKLGIGSSTYYSKLETLYKRCLEFLEEHETAAFKNMQFDEMMLSTDAMVYYLNNVRLKGKSKVLGGGSKDDDIEKKAPTFIIATSDIDTGYVFRADIAYDFDYDLNTLSADTDKYHCDGSYTFLRKNSRLERTYYPKPPRTNDEKESRIYISELNKLKSRLKYVYGCHVSYNYTAAAHYFLIKRLVNSNRWHFVSDGSTTLQMAVFRVFKDEIESKESHYFVCQYAKDLTLEAAGKMSFMVRNDLNDWAESRGLGKVGVMEKARRYLDEYFTNNDIYEYYPGGSLHPSKSRGCITSPLSTKSEGLRTIDFLTDTTDLSTEELADIVSRVNTVTIDNFFQEIRRSISVLERPLVTARGDGKSYIYANYNPKYAQYAITIFRTFYNFCWPKNTFGIRLTPAQKIGIADKVYSIKDIIYFK